MDRTGILAAPQADAAPVVPIRAQDQGVVSLVEKHPSDPAPGQSKCAAYPLMGDHPGGGKVQEAIGELDLAIRDVRNVVFDHHQPDPLSGEQPG